MKFKNIKEKIREYINIFNLFKVFFMGGAWIVSSILMYFLLKFDLWDSIGYGLFAQMVYWAFAVFTLIIFAD